MDAQLSKDEMMAAIYTIHIDNVVAWDDEDITAQQVMEREQTDDESYNVLLQRYELGKSVLRKHTLVATHKFCLDDGGEEYKKMLSFLPSDCVGYVHLVYNSMGRQARLFFFFPHPDPYESRRTMLYHLIVSMDDDSMLVLSCPDGDISLQRIDDQHYLLRDGRDGGHLSFSGYSVQVWTVMYELEKQLHQQFQITPTLAQKLGFLPEE